MVEFIRNGRTDEETSKHRAGFDTFICQGVDIMKGRHYYEFTVTSPGISTLSNISVLSQIGARKIVNQIYKSLEYFLKKKKNERY